jgi:hypothetical protein
MGKLLTDYPWLPDSETHTFHKPSELVLSQLPTDFDRESPEARQLSQILGFKPAVGEELQGLLNKTPDESAREIVKIIVSVSPEMRERMLETIRTMRISEKTADGEETKTAPLVTEVVSPSPAELDNEFRSALVHERPVSSHPEDQTWKGPTPEQEERMRELELEELRKISKKPQPVEKEIKHVGFIKAGVDEEKELREFLLEQYGGCCQICNTKLDLGPDKDPYFEVYHIIEKRRSMGSWSFQGFNVLCLCPNCHALMKYGGRDLEAIANLAEKTANGEAAPEEVRERKGDFYITQILMAGREKELFFTPHHMAKISAFLKLTERQP